MIKTTKKKKYYYDCPIQALYMQKEFGVQFYTIHKSDLSDKKLSFHVDIKNIYNVLIQLLAIYNPMISDNKIYVAPESEHIFEPKEYDIGIYNGELWTFIARQWVLSNDYEQTESDDFIKNIVERDGKHFFNPKEEN